MSQFIRREAPRHWQSPNLAPGRGHFQLGSTPGRLRLPGHDDALLAQGQQPEAQPVHGLHPQTELRLQLQSRLLGARRHGTAKVNAELLACLPEEACARHGHNKEKKSEESEDSGSGSDADAENVISMLLPLSIQRHSVL